MIKLTRLTKSNYEINIKEDVAMGYNKGTTELVHSTGDSCIGLYCVEIE